MKRSVWIKEEEGSVPSPSFLSPQLPRGMAGAGGVSCPAAASPCPGAGSPLRQSCLWGCSAGAASRAVQSRAVGRGWGRRPGCLAVLCFPFHRSALGSRLCARGARVPGPFPTHSSPSSLAANPPALSSSLLSYKPGTNSPSRPRWMSVAAFAFGKSPRGGAAPDSAF